MKTNKKGFEMSPPQLVVGIVLLLAVLVVLLFIFGGESRDFLAKLNIFKDQAAGKKCESIVLSRGCECDEDRYICEEIPPPPGETEWDCEDHPRYCYEMTRRDIDETT